MYELTSQELDEVNGGAALLVIGLVVVVVGAVGVGIYNGYQAAKREAAK